MESSWLLVFLPYLPSNCLDSKYGGGWCCKGGWDSFLQKAAHRHPERAAALQKTESFSRDQNISLQWKLPSPSPESLHGSSCSAQPGICMAGRTSSWDHSIAALCSAQPCDCSLGTLGKSLRAPASPGAKWRGGYIILLRSWLRSTGGSLWDAVFVVQQGSTTNAALSLQLLHCYCFTTDGVCAIKSYLAVLRS